ncbi:MAG: nuclear transport factor 2 family protein [Spirosomaceae bacterium]|jgi:hypothetical protein|nr:nuclear transport factor 2 family protein [Spirosomataceae bacterium]
MNQQIEKIHAYIDAYNNFDVVKMCQDLAESVVFRNIANDDVNLELDGIEAFKAQAQQALSFFSERRQTVTKMIERENQVEVLIDYRAVLAIDLPNGLKKSDTLSLAGRSIFTFANGKIIQIEDIS